MSVRRISPRLQKILHSLATRVPKVVLHRAEDIFPALNTSLVSVCGCVCSKVQCALFFMQLSWSIITYKDLFCCEIWICFLFV